LVWLGLILVVAAVVYFTPRLAEFVTAVQSNQERGRVARHTGAAPAQEIANDTV
jgi:hypothetical protein